MTYTPKSMMSKGKKKSGFQRIVDELTGGCGCGCHTGMGYKTQCSHCSPPPAKEEEWEKLMDEIIIGCTQWSISFMRKKMVDLRSQAYEEGRREVIEEIKSWFPKEKIGMVSSLTILSKLAALTDAIEVVKEGK